MPMASASAPPELSQPATLLTHPTPTQADLARYAALPATGFSTTKASTVCVGTAYKLSSDARALRRLKGTLPILVAGSALNLVNPQTQTPIQSFTLSSAETASSAPLTLLRPLGNGRSLRTTYVGINSHTRAKPDSTAVTATHQLCAYVEELSAKGKESAEIQVRKESLLLPKPVRLIHALGDGRLVITHPDASLTIVSASPITYDDEASVQAAATALQVIDAIAPTQSPGQHRSHFYVNVLDASSAKALVSGSSRIEEAALIGLRVAITSESNITATSSHADDETSKKKKRSKRLKKYTSSRGDVNEADDDETGSSLPAVGTPSGPLTLELTAFTKSFDGATDSVIVAVRLGNVKLPSSLHARNILDVQLHPDGRLILLGIDGHLTSMTLSTSTSGEPLFTNINTILLPALAPATNARPSSSSTASPSSCLLLSRDHALVVGVTQATPATGGKERVAALIVDLELNAVLQHVDWAVPFVPLSGAAASSTGLVQRMTSISASRIAGSTAVITIGPPTVSSRISNSSDKAEALTQLQQRRVCVLSLPFSVPEASVLRDALGKGELTARWISSPDAISSTAAAGSLASDLAGSELLDQITKIAQGNGKAKNKASEISSAISQWIDAATADGRMLETPSSNDDDTAFFCQLLDLVLPAPSQRSNNAAATPFFPRAALLVLLKHPRVHPSIFASLAPSTTPSTRNASMQVNGAGLSEFWSRLATHNDPQLVRAALRRMPDISEGALVPLLTSALRGLVQSRQVGDAEASKAARSFVALLAHMVQLQVSRPALRSALKAHLRDDVDQVMALLQICNAWLSQTIQLPLHSDENIKAGRVDDDAVPAAGKIKAPSADAVMALANDVLDTFFPLLLVTPRSHASVQSLSSTISRYLQLMSTLRQLNAPLSAFAKLQQETNLVALNAGKQKNRSGTSLSASGAVASAGNAKVNVSTKADAAARTEMGGGLGIKLGTQGEAKTRRLQFLEQSMLVGAYSFERLEI